MHDGPRAGFADGCPAPTANCLNSRRLLLHVLGPDLDLLRLMPPPIGDCQAQGELRALLAASWPVLSQEAPVMTVQRVNGESLRPECLLSGEPLLHCDVSVLRPEAGFVSAQIPARKQPFFERRPAPYLPGSFLLHRKLGSLTSLLL